MNRETVYWIEKFKNFKEDLGLTNKDIAELTGLNVNSVNSATRKTKTFPKWLKLAILVHQKKARV